VIQSRHACARAHFFLNNFNARKSYRSRSLTGSEKFSVARSLSLSLSLMETGLSNDNENHQTPVERICILRRITGDARKWTNMSLGGAYRARLYIISFIKSSETDNGTKPARVARIARETPGGRVLRSADRIRSISRERAESLLWGEPLPRRRYEGAGSYVSTINRGINESFELSRQQATAPRSTLRALRLRREFSD